MKRSFSCIFVLCLLGAGVGRAAPLCSTFTNYAGLVGAGAGGCEINGLLFSNFGFASSATGVGTVPTATQMSFLIDDPGTSTGTGQLIYGFEFNPNLSIIGIGSADIQIQYDITAPSATITSLHLLETAAVSAGSTATVVEGPNCGTVTLGGPCVPGFLPSLVVTPSAPHQDLLGIGPYISMHVFKDMNVISTTTNGFAVISNVRDAVDLSVPATVPEVSTCFLLGGGLIGMAMMGKRRSRG